MCTKKSICRRKIRNVPHERCIFTKKQRKQKKTQAWLGINDIKKKGAWTQTTILFSQPFTPTTMQQMQMTNPVKCMLDLSMMFFACVITGHSLELFAATVYGSIDSLFPCQSIEKKSLFSQIFVSTKCQSNCTDRQHKEQI